ncbi:MAG: hypothetical protein A2V67_03915 [Deltaproteobacteria bacterium RBG_13_61_14]|nr:MAG: hypothetical protein A2V67_03915 [Deltaproteobacteria bacterium RBG_13_61_14]
MTISFIDSGVLIAAFRGNDEIARKAFEILDDPKREFASSGYVRLEVLPKPIHFGRTEETAFYQEFFPQVKHWMPEDYPILAAAFDQAQVDGLNAMDALHVAAAVAAKADELVTTEKPDKPIHRTKAIRVRGIR